MRRRIAAVGIFSLVMALLPVQVAVAQPGNDNFGSATVVTEVPFSDTVPNMDTATVEVDEPTETCAPFGNTVWYTLTLGSGQDVSVDTAGSDFDTALAVWTGTGFGDLTLVACNDDPLFGGLQARLTFMADAGVTYLVQAGAFDVAPPGAVLEISFGEAPKPTGRPDKFKSSFRGGSASAFTEEFDGECFSFSDVNVTEGRTKEHQQRPFQSADLFVSSFSECFDEGTGEVTFTDWFGQASLTPDQFDIDKKLRGAFVEATVVVFGQECTESEPVENDNGFHFEVDCIELGPEEVLVSVQWTGQGPTFRSSFSNRFSTEGFRVRSTSKSTSREALVEGGVTNELLSFSLDGAEGFLSKDSFSDMSVIRGGGGFFPF